MCLNSIQYSGVPSVPSIHMIQDKGFPRNARAALGLCHMPQAVIIKSEQVLLPAEQEGVRCCIIFSLREFHHRSKQLLPAVGLKGVFEYRLKLILHL